MDLETSASSILNHNYSAYDCRGLAQAESAEVLVRHYFEQENISFDGWKVSEIPLVDNSGKWPVAIVVCIVNPVERIGISLNFTVEGSLFNCNPDEYAEIEIDTIKETINHPTAKY